MLPFELSLSLETSEAITHIMFLQAKLSNMSNELTKVFCYGECFTTIAILGLSSISGLRLARIARS